MSDTLLTVEGLKVHYPIRGGLLGRPIGFVKAVDGVDLSIGRGESVALVGESGCGKSTLGAALLGTTRSTGGSVRFDGQPIVYGDAQARKTLSRDMQIVFQDPVSALNPKLTVGESIGEPLAIHGVGTAAERRDRVAELLSLVGLHAGHAMRKPNAFSGGQRQRIVIARALALNPKLMILDEPVSALDVSIRSQILNLLLELQRKFGLSYLFISHDLSVVRHFADRVAVMYLGHLVETGPTEDVFSRPVHPYTEALLSAVPLPDPIAQRGRQRIVLKGDLPSPANPPKGCKFVTRCPLAEDICRESHPPLRPVGAGRLAACHLRAG
ncbi:MULTISPECIES: ABC transporter ATP-binding protein [Agrobacterium]|uniref:ATP-binding cassette domain-containing protein n=1 Tax=Agrobacterium tumefaciens TaxID=358 RepID=A0AAE6BGV0_AGRTU|nr:MULTISPECIES: oligopeptide/dipeptide ABC transporter ATP-binding protein [Agrobacterium]QCL77106.1 ATP-binding cassette domain-containing protein [Agrobacterium tumefaciens]QCL82615.1 ATP-binding cassette domain-containing protein [Agrobacterium tumefaciens]CUX70143.1 Oligopeptide transport protein (ABC superfamily, ATP-binding protein) [Agrobacterium sp. NCPPB 925]